MNAVDQPFMYCAFGHVVKSDRALNLPLLANADVAEDTPSLWLRLTDDAALFPAVGTWHPLHEMEDHPGGSILHIWCDDARMMIRYAGWEALICRGESSLWLRAITPAEIAFEHVAERVWIPLYALWTQKTWLALHGSAVARDGDCVVFLGQSGAGKSTTAHELYKRGAVLVSDDMVLVDPQRLLVYSAAPTIRLWPGREVEDVRAHGQISEASSKRWFAMTFQSSWRLSWPLKQLVVLVRDPDAPVSGQCDLMDGIACTIELLRNSFEWSNPTQVMAADRLQKVVTLRQAQPPWTLLFAQSPTKAPDHIDGLPDWISS